MTIRCPKISNKRRRALHAYMLAIVFVVISYPVRAADKILVSTTRASAFVGSLTSIEVYVNDVSVALLGNGASTKIFLKGVKPGKNTVRAVQHSVFGTYPFYQNVAAKTGAKKYFVLKKGVATLTIKVGCTDDMFKNIFAISSEVPEDWDRPKILRVTLDNNLKAVVIKRSPPIKLARATEKTVSDTMRVKHETIMSTHWKIDAELKAKFLATWGLIDFQIKGLIERQTSKQYSVETERTRSVVLRGGNSAGYVRVVWVEYYRTGTATVMLYGKTSKMPFEFREDFDLLTEDAL